MNILLLRELAVAAAAADGKGIVNIENNPCLGLFFYHDMHYVWLCAPRKTGRRIR
jgi:hypothetical protein